MIKFYTIGCKKCILLKRFLDRSGIQYETVDSIEEIACKDIEELPVLEVNGKMLPYVDAIKWIKDSGKND